MTVISVIALKGGVGKTVTTINLAVNLSRRGYRVLVGDADPQGNTTGFFGGDPNAIGMYELLAGEWSDPYELIQIGKQYGVDLVGTDDALYGLNLACIMDGSGQETGSLDMFMHNPLVVDRYDVAIVDCPPGFTVSSIEAIGASDHLLVPILLDKFSFDGWRVLSAQLAQVASRLQRYPTAHPLITMRDNTDLSKEVEPMFRERISGTLETRIRYSGKVREATFPSQSLCDWSPTCNPSKDYECLTDELLTTFRIQRGGAENG